jgi:hypothetical protein
MTNAVFFPTENLSKKEAVRKKPLLGKCGRNLSFLGL